MSWRSTAARCHTSDCAHALEVVPSASHLFEESGALEAVAALAREWFVKHLRQSALADPARAGW